MLAVALIAYPRLPEEIPIHFNAAGQVDGTGPRYHVFLMPGLAALMLIISRVTPRIDPRRTNYGKFQRQYHQIFFVITLLLLFTQLYIIAVSLYPQLIRHFNMGVWMPFLAGLMLVFFGNMMPKFKSNFFTGIKTPWTLADEQVWYRTHRLVGKLWVVCGFLTILLAFLPPVWKLYIFFPLILVMVAVPYVYSYLVFQRIQKQNEEKDAGQDQDTDPPDVL